MDKSCKTEIVPLAVNGFVIIVIASIVIAIVCNSTRRQTPYVLSSNEARTLDEKVQKLEPHFKLRSFVEDIEYHCEVHPSTIGPSHFYDVIAVKVASSDIDKWLGNYYYSSAYDGEKLLSTIEKSSSILLAKATWRHSTKSKVYVNGTDKIIVFKAEGILIMQRSK